MNDSSVPVAFIIAVAAAVLLGLILFVLLLVAEYRAYRKGPPPGYSIQRNKCNDYRFVDADGHNGPTIHFAKFCAVMAAQAHFREQQERMAQEAWENVVK